MVSNMAWSIIFLSFLFVSDSFASWTQQGGDASRSCLGVSPGIRKTPQLLFNATAPMRRQFIGFPVYNEASSLFFLGAKDGFVYAFDAENGKPRWRVCLGTQPVFPSDPCGGIDTSTTFKLQPFVSSDGVVVVLPKRNQPDEVVKVSVKDGSVLWRITPHSYGVGDNLLVLPENGDIVLWDLGYTMLRVDSSSGKRVWNSTFQSSYQAAQSPMTYVADDQSIWTGFLNNVAKVDARTGKLLMNISINNDGQYNDMFYDRRTKHIYLPANQLSWYVFDAVTGEPKYRISGNQVSVGTDTTRFALPCPNNTVVFLDEFGDMTLWNEDAMLNQQELWLVNVGKGGVSRSGAVSPDGVIYLQSSVSGPPCEFTTGKLQAFRCDTGAHLWTTLQCQPSGRLMPALMGSSVLISGQGLQVYA